MMRRRRPIMRGAMVGGMGYIAGKSAANRAGREASQEERIAGVEGQQAAASAPPSAAPATGGTVVEQLKQLGELRDSGVLTPEEFEREKQKILAAG
jgi:Short C-terminal domain